MLRELSAPEAAHVDALLERVERRIRLRIPDLDIRIDADPEFGQLLSDIEAEAVARVFRNPDGYTQESDGDYSYNINRLVASGLLAVTDDEWEQLGVGGGLKMLAPATDGYVAGRYSGAYVPPFAFQYHWPARDEIAEEWSL
nr:Gp19/Gp15/Gp42 family protein [Pseudoclavibacter alba]